MFAALVPFSLGPGDDLGIEKVIVVGELLVSLLPLNLQKLFGLFFRALTFVWHPMPHGWFLTGCFVATFVFVLLHVFCTYICLVDSFRLYM